MPREPFWPPSNLLDASLNANLQVRTEDVWCCWDKAQLNRIYTELHGIPYNAQCPRYGVFEPRRVNQYCQQCEEMRLQQMQQQGWTFMGWNR